jgi:hypothetical protein
MIAARCRRAPFNSYTQGSAHLLIEAEIAQTIT